MNGSDGIDRAVQRAAATTAPAVRAEALSISSSDLITVIGAALALSILVWHKDRVDWWPAAGWYALVVAGPLLLRAVQARFPASRVIRFVADFGPAGYVVALYMNLNPVIDAVNMPLADDWLIAADGRLFGTQPGLVLSRYTPELLNDLALAAYTTHFAWSLILGLVLWFGRNEEKFDEWVTTLMFFVVLNYAFYAVVPAMGPRYFQAAHFDGPVPGALASRIDLLFRGSPVARDCFPSGHTGLAIAVLVFAWREERRFFWIALPVLSLLVVGTLIGRFHYGADLVAAIPLAAASLGIARALRRRRPAGFTLVASRTVESLRRGFVTHRD